MASSLLHQSSAIPSKALYETTETVESATLERNLAERHDQHMCGIQYVLVFYNMINICARVISGALGYSRL